MKEIWKDIAGYEGLYQVSNLARVKSLGNRSNHKDELIMKSAIVLGYNIINLCKNSKRKMFKLHRLVATAFVENPHGKPFVNHIDGNKQNNNASNLEWVTAQENTEHAFRTGLSKAQKGAKNRRSIPVVQMSKDGNVIAEYCGMREAERATGANHAGISACCKGKVQTAGGYRWKLGQ